MPARGRTAIERVDVSVHEIPTEKPESDGTLEWKKTTLVLVEVCASGVRGLGYTYAASAAGELVRDRLADAIERRDALAIPTLWLECVRSVRNLGRPGVASEAISAVDLALWDLKGKLLGQPVVTLLGPERMRVPVYGSGGFTSLSIEELRAQLGGWVAAGIPRVKMKVGRDPGSDVERVSEARDAVGEDVALMVDANGAYTRKQALEKAERFAEDGVVWFEEPVSSDDLEGLRLLRDRAPAGMDVAAGEYGYDPFYFRRMLGAGAVDVLQADATRCGGITGFLRAAALADAWGLPISGHTAPMAHLHVLCAAPRVVHLEWFHDHVRIERALFDGFVEPVGGALTPDLSRPGLGFSVRREELARLAA